MEYSASAVNVVSSNPCVWPLRRTKLTFFYYELMSASNIVTYLPNPPLGNKKIPQISNEIPYTE